MKNLLALFAIALLLSAAAAPLLAEEPVTGEAVPADSSIVTETVAPAEEVAASSETAAVWLEDFDAAKKLAAEKKIPILIDFSGSDWCGWCVKLEKEVFSHDEFKAYASENLVLMLADFPQAKAQDDKVKEQNAKLQEAFKIRGFPTVVLVDAEGKEIDRTGYKEGGPATYIAHLKELLAK